jgi:hypothetical protein
MKKILQVSLFLLGFASYAQVGFGTPVPNSSTMLDIVSDNKGIMIPRVSLTGSTDVTTIINGNQPSLLVYNTSTVSDVKPGYYYWDGLQWLRLASESVGLSSGSGVPTSTNPANPSDGQVYIESPTGVIYIYDSVTSAWNTAKNNVVSADSGNTIVKDSKGLAYLAVDNSTIEFDATNGLQIKDGGITTAKILDANVTASKLSPAVAGTTGQMLSTDGTNLVWSDSNLYGDIKQGIQSSDHNGWIKLDGRALASLTTEQQSRATALGLIGNLPNANNAYLSQNGNTLGSISGSNALTLDRNNLPNITLSGTTTYTPAGSVSSHSHKVNNTTGLSALISTSGDFVDVGDAGGIGSASGLKDLNTVTTSTVTPTFTGSLSTITISNISLNGNVTQNALDIKPMSLSVNVFIYLGN